MIPVEVLLVAVAVLLLLSIASSKASNLLGVPALLLFILTGILASELLSIELTDPWVAQLLGVIALVLILYSGGLSTDIDQMRTVLWPGISLSTIGVLLTALAVGWFLELVAGFTLLEGVMVGAIIASTDAAAVFSVLGSGGIHLRGRLGRLLELESGSNDPMAVFLTIGLIQLQMQPDSTILSLVPLFVQQMAVGAALGYGMGRGMVWVVNRANLNYEGLYPVMTVSLILFTYGMTALLGGNGFLAVYLAGVIMGRETFIHQKSLVRFHDGLAWLMQILMFLALGLLVVPAELIPTAGTEILIAAFLIFVARPIGVAVALLFTRFNWRERLMVSWVGLRGAAPIILGTFPLLAGVPRANDIFNLVFFVVLTSVLIQGPLIVPIARVLHLQVRYRPRPRFPLELESGMNITSEMQEIVVPEGSIYIHQRIVDLSMSENALIVLIGRENGFVVPGGSTMLEANDTLLVLAGKEELDDLRTRIGTCEDDEF